jgi:hypothetical protein
MQIMESVAKIILKAIKILIYSDFLICGYTSNIKLSITIRIAEQCLWNIQTDHPHFNHLIIARVAYQTNSTIERALVQKGPGPFPKEGLIYTKRLTCPLKLPVVSFMQFILQPLHPFDISVHLLPGSMRLVIPVLELHSNTLMLLRSSKKCVK